MAPGADAQESDGSASLLRCASLAPKALQGLRGSKHPGERRFQIDLAFRLDTHVWLTRQRRAPSHAPTLRRRAPKNKDKGTRYLLDSLAWVRDESCEEEDYRTPRYAQDVCVHYSLKYQARGRGRGKGIVEEPAAALDRFCRTLSKTQTAAKRVLLVTGSQPRAQDAAAVLESMGSSPATRKHAPPSVAIHVAFNPYHPTADMRASELDRLRRKLRSGLVRGVWLQIGSDVSLLVAGLEALRALMNEGRAAGWGIADDVELYGGVFLPSKLLIAQQKFRPWKGVYLSPTYLSSVESARAITVDTLRVFRSYGVVPLVESKLTKPEHAQAIEAMFTEATGGGVGVEAEGGLGSLCEDSAPR